MVCQEYFKNYEKVKVPLRKYIIGLPLEKNSKNKNKLTELVNNKNKLFQP